MSVRAQVGWAKRGLLALAALFMTCMGIDLWASDSYVQLPPDPSTTTGPKIDSERLTVGPNLVARERHEITGAAAAEIARVLNAAPATGDYGLTVREIGHTDPTKYLPIRLTDGSAFYSASGGGSSGTEYAEDAASTGAELMTLAGAVREDSPASSTTLTGDYTNLKTDSAGRLWVNGSGATQPVSGTVTANAGSGTFTVGDGSGPLTVDGTVDTELTAGQQTMANSVSVALASNQSALPITDNAGSLTVDGTVSITANSSVNVAQVAGTATDTNSGTKSAGTQRIVIATDQPQLTNALKVDGSAVTQPVSGTVTANIGTSGSLALDATVSGLHVAQNSTTSGQTGPLVQGAVTTAAPSYTTAKTSPLSLTTTGLLRVDGSGVTQPISGTVTANAGTGTLAVSNTVLSVVGAGAAATAQRVTLANDLAWPEDSPASNADQGLPIFGFRNDTNAVTTSADGDYTLFSTDSTGRMRALDAGDKVEDVPAVTADIGHMILGQRNDAATTLTSADGDYGTIRIDGTGALAVNVLSVIPGVAATSLGKAEDAASVSGDTGVVMLGVRNDAATALNADGDYGAIRIDSAGNPLVTINAMAAGAGSITKAEDAASASGDFGSFMVGIRNDGSATQTTSANGDYAQVSVDAYGAVYTRGGHPNSFNCDVSAMVTSTQCQAAPGASLSLYITGVMMSNGATAQTMLLRQGTGSVCGTGPSTLYGTVNLAVNSTVTQDFSTPIKVTANNALCCIISGTTAASCTVQGFTAP